MTKPFLSKSEDPNRYAPFKEQRESMEQNLANMNEFTYINKAKIDDPYYGKDRNWKLKTGQKVAITKEIQDTQEWLRRNTDEQYMTNLQLEFLEAEVRLLLVKQFIYG